MGFPNINFGIKDNPLLDSPFVQQDNLKGFVPPPIGNFFLLSTGSDFLLSTGDKLLLSG